MFALLQLQYDKLVCNVCFFSSVCLQSSRCANPGCSQVVRGKVGSRETASSAGALTMLDFIDQDTKPQTSVASSFRGLHNPSAPSETPLDRDIVEDCFFQCF